MELDYATYSYLARQPSRTRYIREIVARSTRFHGKARQLLIEPCTSRNPSLPVTKPLIPLPRTFNVALFQRGIGNLGLTHLATFFCYCRKVRTYLVGKKEVKYFPLQRKRGYSKNFASIEWILRITFWKRRRKYPRHTADRQFSRYWKVTSNELIFAEISRSRL